MSGKGKRKPQLCGGLGEKERLRAARRAIVGEQTMYGQGEGI